MPSPVNPQDRTRPYRAPRRAEAAAATRRAILRASKKEFEERGWAATTMRSIATRAGVSPKTIEALFGTKPALLEATLMFSLGSDAATVGTGAPAIIRPESVLEIRSEGRRKVDEALDAAMMLERFGAVATDVSKGIAHLWWAIEMAVPSDERLAALWARLTEAHWFGANWAATVVLQKPGVRRDLTVREAAETLFICIDPNMYRTLTIKGGMTTDEAEAWIVRCFHRLLLA